jgi:hypothetical protein
MSIFTQPGAILTIVFMPANIGMSLSHNSLLHIGFMPEAEKINPQIMEAYLQMRDTDFLKCSHFFGGRFENRYLAREFIPSINTVLTQAEALAKKILLDS